MIIDSQLELALPEEYRLVRVIGKSARVLVGA